MVGLVEPPHVDRWVIQPALPIRWDSRYPVQVLLRGKISAAEDQKGSATENAR